MFNKWLYRRLPYFLRRRLTPQQSPFVVVVLLACTVIILQFVSFLFSDDDISSKMMNKEKMLKEKLPTLRRPLANVVGIPPNLLANYAPNSDKNFKCLSSSKGCLF